MNEHDRWPQSFKFLSGPAFKFLSGPEQIQFPTFMPLAIRHIQLTDNFIARHFLDLLIGHDFRFLATGLSIAAIAFQTL